MELPCDIFVDAARARQALARMAATSGTMAVTCDDEPDAGLVSEVLSGLLSGRTGFQVNAHLVKPPTCCILLVKRALSDCDEPMQEADPSARDALATTIVCKPACMASICNIDASPAQQPDIASSPEQRQKAEAACWAEAPAGNVMQLKWALRWAKPWEPHSDAYYESCA